METLVWGLFLMVHNPERCTTPDMPARGCESFVSLNVTYPDKRACSSVAGQLSEMHTQEKTNGIYVRSNVSYVCVLQPKPGAH
jgi:hypothetical protein